MSGSPLTRVFITVVVAMAIVLSALAVQSRQNPPDQLPDSTSEMLKSVSPGEVLS